MNYLFKALVLHLFILNTSSVIECKKLKLVFVIHRHGDRTPVFTYPTDPYADYDKYWPEGIGQLTAKGKQRIYSVGKYIRKRYENFLTDDSKELWVRSSAKERCLESAALLLTGLYPSVGRWVWDDNQGTVWKMFPIQTKNFSHDGFLNPGSICPMASKESQRIMESEDYKKFLQNNEVIIKLIEEKTGLNFDHHWIGRDLFITLFIQRANGLKLPDWVSDSVYEDLNHLADISFVFDASTKLMLKFRAGLVLKEIIETIEQSISDKNFTQKIFVYSTHDSFLSVFLQSLNAYNSKYPPFGATIFLELYETSENQFSFELFYLNETETEQPYKLSINCNSHIEPEEKCDLCIPGCSLENFLDLTKDLIPKDWEKECNKEDSFFDFALKFVIKQDVI